VSRLPWQVAMRQAACAKPNEDGTVAAATPASSRWPASPAPATPTGGSSLSFPRFPSASGGSGSGGGGLNRSAPRSSAKRRPIGGLESFLESLEAGGMPVGDLAGQVMNDLSAYGRE
jgi:hypothetical protein